MTEFKNTPCWNSQSADAVLRTEALETSRAVFMAVHSSIRDYEVEGLHAGLVAERTEQGLLDALHDSKHKHIFCVIEGRPGSGKSHLTRWLQFNWPSTRDKGKDLLLMVPRADGSLEGSLRLMRDSLPDEYQGIFAGLGQTHDTTLAGRARDFHSKLANSLASNYFVGEAPPHAEWAENYKLSRLVGHQHVIEKWAAPLRLLETLSGGSERNSRTDSFSFPDMLELIRLLRPVKDRMLDAKTIMMKGKFGKEADVLKRLLEETLETDAFQEQVASHAPNILRLQEALNGRFNAVVQDLIGIGRDGLVRAFRELRERLALRNTRLVLLLEDITSFQGVDKQLLDVLVTKSETQGKEVKKPLCDLVSVVGITTDFYNQSMKSYGNLRDRIALHVRLGSSTDGQVQDSLALANADNREAFVTNYLRAIRAGVDEIEEWAERSQDGEPVPNRCVGCQYRTPCHRGFGANAEGVGFFPLSPRIIARVFGVLRDPHGTKSLRTPRGLVQNVLSPLMFHPERLRDGQFPPANLEGEYLPEDERRLVGQVATIVRDRVEDDDERDRLRRFVVWWSAVDPGVQTERDERGRRLFAGIATEAYDAFDLPFFGDREAVLEDLPFVGTSEEHEGGPEPTPEVPDQETPPPKKPKTKPQATTSAGTPSVSSPKPRKVTATKMSKMRAELVGWVDGGRVASSKDWSKILMEILDQLPWRSMGIPYWVQARLFSSDSVILKGATGKESVRHFILPRASWVQQGLDSWILLSTTKKGGEAEYARRRVGRFLRRLKRLVHAHVGNRSLDNPEGQAWSPAGSAAQALLARAWLQGRIDMGLPMADQWQALMEPETGSAESASNHTQGWTEVVHRVGHFRTPFQDLVREWVSLASKPGQDTRGVVDAAAIAPSLIRLGRDLDPDRPPPEALTRKLPKKLKVWESAAKVGRTLRKIMPALPGHELTRVFADLERLETACGKRALPQYIREVGQAISDLRKVDAEAPHLPTEDWKRAKTILTEKGLMDGHVDGSLQRLEDFLADAGPEERDEVRGRSSVEKLAWLIAAPSSDLSVMAAEIGNAEKALDTLWQHAEQVMQASGTGDSGSPEALQQLGARLRDAVDALRESLALEATD